MRVVGEGDALRLRVGTGPRGEELFPTGEETERAAKERERLAKEAAIAARDTALERVLALETQLRSLRLGRRRARKNV